MADVPVSLNFVSVVIEGGQRSIGLVFDAGQSPFELRQLDVTLVRRDKLLRESEKFSFGGFSLEGTHVIYHGVK